MPAVVTVAVSRPLRNMYTYEVEEHAPVGVGSVVEVPFGHGNCRGVVLDQPHEAGDINYKLKKVAKIHDAAFSLTPSLIELGRWMSDYYLAPLGEVLHALSCSSLVNKPVELSPQPARALGPGHELSPLQADALDKIRRTPPAKPVLLHGVTGSGKTEVYLRLVEETLALGQSCLYLLPEITLTRETLRKLGDRFSPILVFHSGMTPKERRETWLAARSPGPHLVVGARSALFSPLEKLGLIIVDEEHDSSFKQDSSPRYHARDLAVVRGLQEGARVVLGSATPALESYENARQGRYQLVEMHQRISQHAMPEVSVVDLRSERSDLKLKGTVHFSRSLIERTLKTVAAGRQVIFFLNRRGYSTAMTCTACGKKRECPHCSVAMTYYRRRNEVACHYCGHSEEPSDLCPACGTGRMVLRGTGTEKIQQLVEQVFPGVQIVRVDGSADGEGDIQDRLARFMQGEGHILLGTQIISKGLDSPNIRLSAALNADLGLGLPDFRAAERDFQLLTQLAGRPGRGAEAGECIFQTSSPGHYAIRHSIAQDYRAFFEEERGFRSRYGYPPCVRLARLIFSATKPDAIERKLRPLLGGIRARAKAWEIELLGPAPAPIEKIKAKYRWHLIAKSASSGRMTKFLQEIMADLEKTKGLDFVLDRDPQNMM